LSFALPLHERLQFHQGCHCGPDPQSAGAALLRFAAIYRVLAGEYRILAGKYLWLAGKYRVLAGEYRVLAVYYRWLVNEYL
jgi:hypothetical protein